MTIKYKQMQKIKPADFIFGRFWHEFGRYKFKSGATISQAF